MKDWIDNDLTGAPSTRRGIEDKRVGGGGRVASGGRDKRKSISPTAKMRKRGEDFLKKIEQLKETL
jgi:hypothetical protein